MRELINPHLYSNSSQTVSPAQVFLLRYTLTHPAECPMAKKTTLKVKVTISPHTPFSLLWFTTLVQGSRVHLVRHSYVTHIQTRLTLSKTQVDHINHERKKILQWFPFLSICIPGTVGCSDSPSTATCHALDMSLHSLPSSISLSWPHPSSTSWFSGCLLIGQLLQWQEHAY